MNKNLEKKKYVEDGTLKKILKYTSDYTVLLIRIHVTKTFAYIWNVVLTTGFSVDLFIVEKRSQKI